MNSNKTILLDVQLEGMLDFIRDMGWKVDTVTKLFGTTESDRKDDKIIEHAKNNRNTVVVTQDQGLTKRCRSLGINVVGIEMDNLAKMVDKELREKFS